MFRSLWFHKLLGLNSRSVRRRQASQTRRRVQPQLEGLEDRITPATFIGDPTNAAQLLGDFNYANSHPGAAVTINLNSANTYNLNDVASELQNSANTAGITINGGGATITAAAGNRVFELDAGTKLVLKDLTVKGGNLSASTAQGGGIADFKGGELSLSGVNVSSNVVKGDSTVQGGGIFVTGNGTLTIQNGSSIEHNQAIGSSAGGSVTATGGGLFVSGSVTVNITDSTLSNDLAKGGNGSASGFNALGGALAAFGPNTISITGSTLSNNRAQGGHATGTIGSGGVGEGGGLFVTGAGWNVTLTGSTLSSNTAAGGNGVGSDSGGDAGGGGAFVTGTGTGFSIVSSSVTGNTAQGGLGGKGSTSGAGGAGGSGVGGGAFMMLGGTTPLTITGSSFSTNSANGGKGGTGGAGTGTGGTGGAGGTAVGGALGVVGGSLTITSSSFDSNSANAGNGGNGGAGITSTTGGNGGTGGTGGFAVGGAAILSITGSNAITNSSFTNNSVIGGSGGAGGTGGVGTTGSGGNGGNGGNAGTASIGGASFNAAGGGLFNFGAAVTMINTTLGANTAQGGNVGAAGAGGVGSPTHGAAGSAGSSAGSAFGGGMFSDSPDTLINDTIAFNSVVRGTGGSTTPTGQGGGIFNTSGLPTLTNVILEANTAHKGPDFFGSLSTASSYDFISSSSGITNFTTAGPGTGVSVNTGMIFNNTVPQLNTTLLNTAGGLAYYTPLASSAIINAGTNGVISTIAGAEGVTVPNATDEIGNARIVGPAIDMGAIEFEVISTTTSVSPVVTSVSTSPTQVQLNATITSATGAAVNEGTVTFTVSGIGGTIANIPVVNGQASASFTVPGNIPAGGYTITATYSDPVVGLTGGRFATSTGSGTLSVQPIAVPTTVVAGNGGVTYSTSAQPDDITVLVNSSSTVNGGTVNVTLGGVTVGTGSVSNGSASVALIVPAGQPVGSYQLQEIYSGVVGAFSGSTAFGTLTVSAAATTVAPGNATATFSTGTQTTSITVGVSSPGGIVNGGTVNVLLNGNTVGSGTVSAGSTTVTLNLPASLSVGSYILTENYTGTSNFSSSTANGTLLVSAAATTVTPGNATTTFSTSTQTTSVTVGVTGSNGVVNSGTVNVVLNGNTVGTGTVSNGSATVTVTVPASLAAGSYTLAENYSGDLNNGSSTANGTLTVSASSTTVTAGNATATFSTSTQTSNVTVSVSSANGTVNSGTVTITLNGNTVGTGNVSNGSATVALNLPAGQAAGSYTLEEDYTDGTNFGSSTANGTLNVLGASTTLTAGNATVDFNGSSQTVNITVGVNSPSGPVNSGTVTVLLNGSSIGTGNVSNGSATISLTIPAGQAAGSYSLTEKYSGDANLSSSTANGTLTVNAASSPSTPSTPSTLQAALTIAIDVAALLLQSDPSALAQLGTLSHVFLGVDLPLSTSGLIAAIQANVNYADGLVSAAVQAGVSYADTVS